MSFPQLMAEATQQTFAHLGEPARYAPTTGPAVDTRAIYAEGVQVLDEYQRVVGERNELKLMIEAAPNARAGEIVTVNPDTPGAVAVRLDARLARNRYQDHWAVTRG